MNANERIKELVRQRDSARAWAVELEQRIEVAEKVLVGGMLAHPTIYGCAALRVLAGGSS